MGGPCRWLTLLRFKSVCGAYALVPIRRAAEGGVQCHGGANERLQRLFIDLVVLMEIPAFFVDLPAVVFTPRLRRHRTRSEAVPQTERGISATDWHRLNTDRTGGSLDASSQLLGQGSDGLQI